jgi:hypothetical protein
MTPLESITVAIFSGLKDGWNPYMFSGVACCIIFLTLIAENKRRVVLAGRSISASMFLITFALAWGMNLLMLDSPQINIIFRLTSLGFAVALIVTGYTLLRQWWMTKKGAQGPQIPESRRLGSTFGMICFSIILGALISIINMLWLKNPDLYVTYYILMTSGDPLQTALFLVLYSGAFTGYLTLGCWLTAITINSVKFQKILVNSLSMARITCSAVCLALGIGLIYMYIAA